MLFERHLKNRKVIVGIFAVVLAGLGIFAFSSTGGGQAFFGSLLSTHSEKVDLSDFDTDEITIGDTKLIRAVKGEDTPDEGWSTEFRFYSAGENPKLLATVESMMPPLFKTGNADSKIYPQYYEKDITGDDVPEIFIKVQESGSGLMSYEVLRLENGKLENIRVKGEKNPWLDFHGIEYADGHISIDWSGMGADHGNETGRAFYSLDGNELVLLKTVRFTAKFVDGIETCDVEVKKPGDKDFMFIENVLCDGTEEGSPRKDRYFYFSDEQLDFLKQMNAISNDPKWKDLVVAYRNNCEIGGRGATFGGREVWSLTDLVQRAEPGRVDDTKEIINVPCGQGAYQSWYLPVLYDGVIYSPLKLTKIKDDQTRYEEYTAVESGYNSETGIFSYLAAGNGQHTCWEEGEYKLVGRELVLQKFTADNTCEEGLDDGVVLFDINRR